MSRNHYIVSLLLAHIGRPQLQGDSIEVLRRSNYELAKIGTNLNQIAKAFNQLMQLHNPGKMPEIGKRMAALRVSISDHTRRVLRVLESGTVLWEAKGRGQRKPRGRKALRRETTANT